MAQQNNTTRYSGNAAQDAINFRRKDVYINFSSWHCQLMCFLHHHTGLNPVDHKDPETLKRNRKIGYDQIINYIQNN
jgi:hypothetical protein